MGWYDIKAKTLSFFSDIRIYPGGIIFAGDSHYKLKGPQMREVLNLIEPGDVMLRRYSHYLGSVAVKGHFSHAAIYVGDNNVVHMLGDGITREDILTFLRCDDLLLLRARDSVMTNIAINKAQVFLVEGIEYDYNFDIDSPTKFYCTELVDNCFDYPVKKSLHDSKIVLPDDFMTSGYFDTIWEKR